MRILILFWILLVKNSLIVSVECTTEEATNQLPITKDRKQTICLNMIVKDEQDVIFRCLQSVKPLIDFWVIVDTGSTDGTQAIIRDALRDVPGELHERPWVNFAHNRNEALKLAKNKSDYILFIDADEVLEYPKNYRFPKLDKDSYFIVTKYNGLNYCREQLLKSSVNCEWKGVVHEVLHYPSSICRGKLQGVYNIVRSDGCRSKDPKKYIKDAQLLEQEIEKNPNDSRSIFYLAQSYRDAENFCKAVENYKRRIALGGWDQEIFWSLLQIAIIEELQEIQPSEKIISNYYQAFQQRPIRAEPLYYLAKYYRKQNDFAACYTISKLGLMIPYPKDCLFVENYIYDYGLKLECSIGAYWLGKYEESKQLSQQILSSQKLPENVRTCVENNINFAINKIP